MDFIYQVRENIANQLITTTQTRKGALNFLSKKISKHYSVYYVHYMTGEVRSIISGDRFMNELLSSSCQKQSLELEFEDNE